MTMMDGGGGDDNYDVTMTTMMICNYKHVKIVSII
jgi:hypothetical protein